MVDASTCNGFVETELGLLPSDWDVTTLNDISEFLQYGTSQRCDLEPIGMPVLRIPNVIGGGIDTTELKYTELSEKDSGKLRLKNGDLLFVRTNGRKEYVGRCAIYEGLPPGASFASYLIRSRLNADLVVPEFVQAYCSTSIGKQYLSERASSASDGKFNINTQILKAVVVPMPSLDEQRAIVSVLRTVQRAKEATEKVIAAARQLKQSLMRHLFTYGPVPFQEADKVELQESEVGSSPAHWRICRFSEVVEPVSGQVDPKVSPYAEMIHVGPENIEEGTGRLTARLTAKEVGLTSGKYLFDESHVLYSKIRPYLRKVCLPHGVGICSADMYPLIPSAVLSRDFLYAWLLSNQFTTQAVSYQSRTGIPKINRTQLGSTFIPVPPLREQDLIAKSVIDTDAKINAELIKHNALSLTFDSLLHELMTGQRRVHELDLEFTEEEAA